MGNTILGMNTWLPTLKPVIIYASITFYASCVVISLSPLHISAEGFMLHNNIIGVSIFKDIAWDDTLLKSS
jgi:hypothetical protein